MINSGRACSGVSTCFPANVTNYKGPEIDLQAIYGLGNSITAYRVFNHTGFVALLPFIEQDNVLRLAEAWRDSGPPGNARWAPWYTAHGTQPQNPVLAMVIPTYICPLDDLTQRAQLGYY